MRAPAVLLVATIATGQSFEVAAIKPHTGALRMIGVETSGTAVNLEAMSVWDLVMYAYDKRSFQIDGGDKWTSEDRFDISARAPGDTTPVKPQIQAMVRTLLKERFNIATRPSAKEMPVFALVPGKNGPRLKTSEDPAAQQMLLLRGEVASYTAAPVAMLANSFPFRLERPILDRTGLTGKYDFELKLKPGPEGPTGPSGESLFTAIEEQLGLKLEPTKAVVETLVIEHAERPSEN
jgi:uncharacterized protein (TIGR03435 family)